MLEGLEVWEIIVQIAIILAAAIIATILRFWDFEHNKLTDLELVTFATTLLGAIVAAFIGWWYFGAQDVTVFANFVLVAVCGLGGMSFVRALFETAKTKLNLGGTG
jgi:membrane protein YdbS with pleckstrin-like domain